MDPMAIDAPVIGADEPAKGLADVPECSSTPVAVRRTVTSTGVRMSAPIPQEQSGQAGNPKSDDASKPKIRSKEEPPASGLRSEASGKEEAAIQENVAMIQMFFGPEMSESYITRALSVSGNDPHAAVNLLLDSQPVNVGPAVKQEHCPEIPKIAGGRVPELRVKGETDLEKAAGGSPSQQNQPLEPKSERPKFSADEEVQATGTKAVAALKMEVKREDIVVIEDGASSKEAATQSKGLKVAVPKSQAQSYKPSNLNNGADSKQVVSYVGLEDGDFPQEPDWLLVGRTMVSALSMTRGSKLVDNEIVHFAFPTADSISRHCSQFVKHKTAVAISDIVRFSTKRHGEIGRLPMEWARSLCPLINSKVKVFGRCVAAPMVLTLMQDIILCLSFYVHYSVFTEGDKTSWKLESHSCIDPTLYPLPRLLKLLKMQPYQKAEFTPEELDSRKRSPKLAADEYGAAKRRKGTQQTPVEDKDEQALSESSLNKLVGMAENYDLKEMEPPSTLSCVLKPYQKQALYWMSESENGIDVEKAAKTLHPCWSAYNICDERVSSIYVNIFTGEATMQFPTATQMARGGILADAMGLGKTVMTIALILAKRGRGNPDNQKLVNEVVVDPRSTQRHRRDTHADGPAKAKGCTLVVCPMALLGQWKDELETHSKPESISILVHYGGYRINDPRIFGKYDVVLTTYGVLSAAYKSDGEDSIFHTVDWYRVVLDEAHNIKSSKAQVAQAAFKLSSYCRWCLTGTPLQNHLEDLYSLLCFLRVEPWCDWSWWSKLIQRPYECGDQRGLKLIKAILRPLMLRRTKETKDKGGRPILSLPPTDIQTIECEQSEAEHEFYNGLFRRSQIKFDQFVEQGKVLQNYANILELLLRLRQCCNHPFLVMSRGDTQKYTDLDKLARRFLQASAVSAAAPSQAYVEEVVEGIRRGENTECPICMEYADDAVLTPCAHRMCRECLLSCWSTPTTGPCPICRQVLKQNDLFACPSESRFRFNAEESWKESSKVLKLLNCLECICPTGEKTIIFSQWTSFFDLLEIAFKKKGIGYLRFDGQLAQKQRESVLKEFNTSREKMVLLMSLKAGGVGLNLTAASNVFIMDPWWNPAVEEQAIMRIHRIGQMRTVKVRRLIVKDTVEERMQQVQARKQRMIAGALTDEEVRSARIEELKMLFK